MDNCGLYDESTSLFQEFLNFLVCILRQTNKHVEQYKS